MDTRKGARGCAFAAIFDMSSPAVYMNSLGQMLDSEVLLYFSTTQRNLHHDSLSILAAEPYNRCCIPLMLCVRVFAAKPVYERIVDAVVKPTRIKAAVDEHHHVEVSPTISMSVGL